MLLSVLALLAGALPPGVAGTYRVAATVRLSEVPLLRTLELHGDVVLRPDDRPRVVRARLAARDHACDLAGTLSADGALSFAPGQRCTIALDDPAARGEVLATLRSGGGRVADGRIELRLELALAGTVRLAEALPGLGRETVVPIRGDASVRAEGRRDNSRAAER